MASVPNAPLDDASPPGRADADPPTPTVAAAPPEATTDLAVEISPAAPPPPREPDATLASHFPEEALQAHCAIVAREMLGDFAPALLLLPATERQRARTLLAYAAALLACSAPGSRADDRQIQVDLWDAALQRAMSGGSHLPPLCVGMARENARRRWPNEALAELTGCARSQARQPRPATVAELQERSFALARSLARALLESHVNAEVNGFAGALIRLRALQDLGESLAAGRCPLPEEEAPDPHDLTGAISRECARLRPALLRAPRGLLELPIAYRRVGVFALLAALQLLSEIEEGAAELVVRPPRLGTTARIAHLARARWFRPHGGFG